MGTADLQRCPGAHSLLQSARPRVRLWHRGRGRRGPPPVIRDIPRMPFLVILTPLPIGALISERNPMTRFHVLAVSALLLALAAGCGSYPPPTERLTTAEAAIRGAEE